MKRLIAGLTSSGRRPDEPPDGVYLVRIERVRFENARSKPFYTVEFSVLEPKPLAGGTIHSRIYSTPKALWKLSWFLCDFGYDKELFGRDEIDERRLVGLRGVVKISRATFNGRRLTNLDAFAPAEVWDEAPQRVSQTSREAAS